MTTRPKVSVIIAAYNCGPYLPTALDSVLGQTLPPAEVIVVDDGSTDDTPAVLARYAGRVVAVRQPNAGETAARNRALEAATGEYVAVLDADDLSAPERLERQFAALAARPDAVACVTGFWRFTDAEPLVGGVDGDARVEEADPIDFWTDPGLACVGTVMFDRTRAGDLRYPPGIPSGGDMLFLGMLRSRGKVIALPERLYGYRGRPGSSSRTNTPVDGFRFRFAWAKQNWPAYWPGGSEAELERRFWQKMTELTARAYWARRADQFLALRGFLRSDWPPKLPSPPEARWWWYPDWLWAAKGWLDRVRPRGRRDAGPASRA
jgi:glycosyltransferase involved in cell wall biosynthesis